MTKPIVAVGLCMLYEEAIFQIDDPVYYFLGPQWKKENMKVSLFECSAEPIQLPTHQTPTNQLLYA